MTDQPGGDKLAIFIGVVMAATTLYAMIANRRATATGGGGGVAPSSSSSSSGGSDDSGSSFFSSDADSGYSSTTSSAPEQHGEPETPKAPAASPSEPPPRRPPSGEELVAHGEFMENNRRQLEESERRGREIQAQMGSIPAPLTLDEQNRRANEEANSRQAGIIWEGIRPEHQAHEATSRRTGEVFGTLARAGGSLESNTEFTDAAVSGALQGTGEAFTEGANQIAEHIKDGDEQVKNVKTDEDFDSFHKKFGGS